MEPFQEDEVYYDQEMARVVAELVRPDLRSADPSQKWGGYTFEQLVVAAFARAVQTREYVHHCSDRYCLKHRASCRFFFPWPKQMQQQYDENPERIAYQRRHAADDLYIIPHQLEMMCAETGTVHVVAWDPFRNAAFGKLYGTKYAAKPEPGYYLECEGTVDNPVKQFLCGRTIGLPMAIYRLLNFHIVSSTMPCIMPGSSFCSMSSQRQDSKTTEDYPDPKHYLGLNQWYFLRNKRLWHLRLEQYIRYFVDNVEAATWGLLFGPEDESWASVPARHVYI